MRFRILAIALAALVVPTVLFAEDAGGSPKPSGRVPPHLSSRPATSTPRLPVPLPPALPETTKVEIVGLPLDEDGHIIIHDHPHGPRPVNVTNFQSPSELAGFTLAVTLPDVGVFGMTRLCAAELPGSRMCTLPEALNTTDPPAFDRYVPAAWIRDDAISRSPGLVKEPTSPEDGSDPAAASAPQNTQCLGWGSTQGWATALSSTGAVGVRRCDSPAPVACCRPR